ncbi:hypothetical protein [Aneurinibacillus terranovensis]|uniref:hypothetical protein n=1 Tax=Aneurinibacillus terranovensis TaxID=278991 RepID=UPI0004202838
MKIAVSSQTVRKSGTIGYVKIAEFSQKAKQTTTHKFSEKPKSLVPIKMGAGFFI